MRKQVDKRYITNSLDVKWEVQTQNIRGCKDLESQCIVKERKVLQASNPSDRDDIRNAPKKAVGEMQDMKS